MYPLDPRNDVYDHSPDGFEWGYGGSGPAQSALAILCDLLGDPDEALKWYQDFKTAFVCKCLHEGWELTEEHAHVLLHAIQRGRRKVE